MMEEKQITAVCGGDEENGGDKAIPLENHPADSRITLSKDATVQTLTGRMGTSGNNTPMLMEVYSMQGFGDYKLSSKASTCKERDYKDSTDLVVQTGNRQYIVRRLTPLECERLQGLPDGWTDIGPWKDSKGKLHKESSDAARYKAIGNGIACPPWRWVLERLSQYCGEDKTMASLFDGIATFPLIWEEINGKGTCLWGSEIDEFAAAVSKYHFPDTEENREVNR